MKKVLSVLMAVLMVFTMIPATSVLAVTKGMANENGDLILRLDEGTTYTYEDLCAALSANDVTIDSWRTYSLDGGKTPFESSDTDLVSFSSGVKYTLMKNSIFRWTVVTEFTVYLYTNAQLYSGEELIETFPDAEVGSELLVSTDEIEYREGQTVVFETNNGANSYIAEYDAESDTYSAKVVVPSGGEIKAVCKDESAVITKITTIGNGTYTDVEENVEYYGARTITAIPDASRDPSVGYYVESIKLDGEEVALKYDNTVATASLPLVSGQEHSVEVTFGEIKLAVKDPLGDAKKNGLFSDGSEIEASVFEAVVDTEKTTASTDGYAVYIWGKKSLIDSTPAYTKITELWGVGVCDDQKEQFKVVLPATDKYPELYAEATLNVVDSRPAVTLPDDFAEPFHFDTIDEIKAYIKGEVSKATYTDASGNVQKIDLNYDLDSALEAIVNDKDGEEQLVTFTAEVSADVNHLGASKEYKLTVIGKVHQPTITFGENITVKDMNGNPVTSGGEVDAGEYTVTVTPDSGEYVKEIKVNDKIHPMSADNFDDTVYSFKYSVENGDFNAENTYNFTAELAERALVLKEDATIPFVYGIDTFETIKDDIFSAVVDTTRSDGVSELADVVISTDAADEDFTDGAEITVTVTAVVNNELPEISKEVTIKISYSRVNPEITVEEIPEYVISSAVTKGDIVNYIKDYVLTTSDSEISYEVADFEPPVQGGTKDVTVTITTEQTASYNAAEKTATVTLNGNVVKAAVNEPTVVGDGTVEVTNNGDEYTVTLTPADTTYIGSLSVTGSDTVTEFDGRSYTYTFTAVDGTGKALGTPAHVYNIKATFEEYNPLKAEFGQVAFNPKKEATDDYVAKIETAVKNAVTDNENATVKLEAGSLKIGDYEISGGWEGFSEDIVIEILGNEIYRGENGYFKTFFDVGTKKILVSIPESGKYPAFERGVEITVYDERPEAVITCGEYDAIAFDSAEEILPAIKDAGFITSEDGEVTLSLENTADIATDKDGQKQYASVKATVAESVSVRGKSETYSIEVIGKVHQPTITFGDGIKVESATGEITSGSAVEAGEYTVTVTPVNAAGYIDTVTLTDKLIDDELETNGTYEDGVYTFTFTAVNGDEGAEQAYTIEAAFGTKEIAINENIAVMFNPANYVEDELEADIIGAAVNKGSCVPTVTDSDVFTLNLAEGDTFEKGEIKVDITWAGDDRYPEVTAKDVTVTLTDERVETVITVNEDNIPTVKVDSVDEITEENIIAAVKENNVFGATVNAEINYDIISLPTINEGETGNAVVKATITETEAYTAAEAECEVPVYFNIQNSQLTIVAENASVTFDGAYGNTHTITEDGKHIITATPVMGYAIESITFENGDEISFNYADRTATTSKFVLTKGIDYTITVTCVKAEFEFNDVREYDFRIGTDEADIADIYDTAVKAPERKLFGSEYTVKYLAREATTVAVEIPSYTIGSLEIPGYSIDIPLTELWLEVGTEIKEVTLEDLKEDYTNSEYLLYYGAKEFGAGGDGSVERIKVSYEDDKWLIRETETDVTIVDGRESVSIASADTAEAVYGTSAEDILALYGASVVTADGKEVSDDITIKENVEGLSVGEYDITLVYEGSRSYTPATKTVKLTVKKAPATVTVESQVVPYGSDFTVGGIIDPAGINTIDFVIGVDILDGAEGYVQLRLPGKLGEYFEGEMTLEELKEALVNIADLGGDLVDGLGFSSETVNKLVEGIESIAEGLELPNIKIKINGDFTPENIGVYVVGSVTADGNYETAADVGYLVIRPDATKVDLDWIINDENGIITLPVVQSGEYDLRATVVQNELSDEEWQAAENEIEHIFVGVNQNGDIVSSKEPIAQNGAYAELAYILDWGNEVFYAEPIFRAFLISPENVTVNFIDENENNSFMFTYDGTGHGVEAEAFTAAGEKISERELRKNLSLHYYGVMTDGELYDSTEAPVNAGAYTAVATYIESDSEGNYTRFGMNVAAIAIAPAESTVEVESAVKVYNGEGQSLDITATPDEIDEYIIITSGIEFDEELVTLSDMINIDFPERLDALLKEYAPEAYENGVELPDALDAVEAIEKLTEEMEIESKEIDILIENLKTFPEGATVTFKDKDEAAPVNVGAYMVAAIVCEPNYIPSIDAGILAVIPDAEMTELYWNQEDDNGIITVKKAQNFDFGASAQAEGVEAKTVFAGVNKSDIIYLSSEASTEEGAYTEAAYIDDIDAVCYIAKPIIRSYVIIPEIYDVDFVDANENNIFLRAYDGTPKAVQAVAYGSDGRELTEGEMTIRYVGVEGDFDFYDSEEAPTSAGTYSVYAVYTEYDENGRFLGIGTEDATLIIEKSALDFDIKDTTVTYDGEGHFADITSNVETDYLAVIFDGTQINVIFPEDLKEISDALSKYDFTAANIGAKLEEIAGQITDEHIKAALAKITEALSAYGDAAVIINGALPSQAGTYDIASICIAENYITDLSSGTLTIVPAEVTVTIDNQSKYVYQDDPELTYTVEGLVEGDTIENIVLSREEGNTVGDYVISAVYDENKNYNVTVIEGNFNISHDPEKYTVDEAVEPDCVNTGLTEGAHCEGCGEVLIAQEAVPALGHDYADGKVIAPDCVLPGATEHVCKREGCSYVYYDEITDALGHDFLYEITEPTCEGIGYTVGTCMREDCGYSFTTNVKAPTGHKWSDWKITTPATETAAGEKTRECSVDGCDAVEKCAIPSICHKWNEGKALTKATCTEEGVMVYTCTGCENCLATGVMATTEVAIAKIAHDFETIETAATCTEKGTVVVKCKECNLIAGEVEIAETGHTLEKESAVDATCTAEGSVVYACKDCDYSETTVIPVTAHKFTKEVSYTAPKNDVNGAKVLKCEDCDATTTVVIPALRHNIVILDAVAATCENTGLTSGAYCDKCGEVFVLQTVTSATDHTSSDWIIESEATCLVDGRKYKECTVCEKELASEAILAAGSHTESDFIIDKAATCLVDGAKHTECTVCGETLLAEVIPATGHTASGWIGDKNASCAVGGTRHKECTVCGETIEVGVIEATGKHDFNTVVTVADCTGKGYNTHTCTECGYTYIDSYKNALGHSFTAYKSNGDASCTVDGTKTAKCVRCAETRTVKDTGSAKGHKYVTLNAKAPTCENTGLTVGSSCSVCGAVKDAQHAIPANGHKTGKTVTTVATMYKDGAIKTYCSVCNKVIVTKVIDKVASITLEESSLTYTGKKQSPVVVVKDSSGRELVLGKDYTVKATSRKNIGSSKVTVTLIGKYSGTKTLTFKIVPKIVENLQASYPDYNIKLSWQAVKGATGYRVYLYDEKTGKYKKVKDTKKTNLVIKKLKQSEVYTYVVRAYKTIDGVKYFSKDSAKLTTAVKPPKPVIESAKVKKSVVTVNWSAVKYADGYTVSICEKKSGGSYKKVATVLGGKNTTAKLKNLKKGKTYYIRIKAFKRVGGKDILSYYSLAEKVVIK